MLLESAAKSIRLFTIAVLCQSTNGGVHVKTRVRGLREAAKGDFIQLDVLKYRLVPRRNIHFAVHAGVLGRLN